MAPQVAEVALNPKYIVEEESQGTSLPSLQADDYSPKKNQKLKIVLNETSWELISDDVKESIAFEEHAIDWDDGKGDQPMYEIEDARWVILSRPRIYNLHRETNQVTRGYIKDADYGKNYKTVSRIALACLVGDELLKGDDGEVQVFTLKLTSTKTTWIKKEKRSIHALNNAVKKGMGARGNNWVCHLVSNDIIAYPHVAVSAKNGEKSNSTRFGFAEGSAAKNLSEENCALTHALITSDEFRELADSGFGLIREGQEQAPEPIVITGIALQESFDSDALTATLESAGEGYTLKLTTSLMMDLSEIDGEATISGQRAGSTITVESVQEADPIEEQNDDDIAF